MAKLIVNTLLFLFVFYIKSVKELSIKKFDLVYQKAHLIDLKNYQNYVVGVSSIQEGKNTTMRFFGNFSSSNELVGFVLQEIKRKSQVNYYRIFDILNL